MEKTQAVAGYVLAQVYTTENGKEICAGNLTMTEENYDIFEECIRIGFMNNPRVQVQGMKGKRL